jgi:hypothetical protein
MHVHTIWLRFLHTINQKCQCEVKEAYDNLQCPLQIMILQFVMFAECKCVNYVDTAYAAEFNI